VTTSPHEIAGALARDGYALVPWHADTARWAAAALTMARPSIEAEKARRGGLRCEGTWLAGVDLLPNGADGSVADVALDGPAIAAVAALGLAPRAWHAAQVSVVYPGYPRPAEGESAGAARYRQRRDAAHVDGLLPAGPTRRRHLMEPHAFILGLPLSDNAPDAAPLVVWPGSHRLLGAALADAREKAAGAATHEIDLTAPYHAARRQVFDACPRRPLPTRPGQAVLLHRHLLHGIAPWDAPPDRAGRAVAYFRPILADGEAWFATDPELAIAARDGARGG